MKKVVIIAVIALLAFTYIAENYLSDYHLSVLEFLGIYAILTVSLDITNGYTGLFSLGHPAFMAIGAYTSAILTFPAMRKSIMIPALPEFLAHLELPFWLALIIGGILASLSAIVVGYPVLRLKGHYLSVATIGFLIIVQVLITNLEDLTRGPLGLNGIPPYTNLWWVVAWLLITVYVVWRVVNSDFGRVLKAIREDEIAAEVMGVPLARYKLFAFSLGAFFAGVAGGLWAHLVTAITPTTFSLPLAFNLVVMLVVGGRGSITGAITGAVLIGVLSEILRPIEMKTQAYGLTQLITAVLLIIILIRKPDGIFGYRELRLKISERRG